MSTQILMPALSPTMEEGKLAKWHVKEGDSVKPGDILAELETDKATMEFEAVDEGRIGKILVPEGAENVTDNAHIAEMLIEGERKPSPAQAKSPSPLVGYGAPQARKGGNGAAKAPLPEAPKAASTLPQGEGVKVARDPDVPAGTEFVTMTVRDALRDAMAEEMRR